AYNANIPPPEDFAAREKIARPMIAEFAPYIEEYKKVTPQELTRRDHTLIESYNAIKGLLDLTPPIQVELADFRSKLATAMKDKAVLVGWTATAAIADFVPTSLHEKCPGVVVHGGICNGIMAGQMWRRLPWGVAVAFSIVMGLVTALVVGRLAPVRGMIVAGAMIVAYLLINGIVLFDYGNRI